MGNLIKDRSIIYETPDGGQTVYARYIGETDRWVVGKQFANDLLEDLKDNQLWYEIRKAAETNQALNKTLKHAILLYQLIKDADGR